MPEGYTKVRNLIYMYVIFKNFSLLKVTLYKNKIVNIACNTGTKMFKNY